MAKVSTASAALEAPQNDVEMADVEPTTNSEADAQESNELQPSEQPQSESQPAPPSDPPAVIPGPRAQQLFTLHSKALSATLKTISPSTFSACFPTIAASAPDVLASIHTQFISRLREFAEADLKEILRERRVVENLNALEDLILDAKRRKSNSEKAGGGGEQVGDEKPLPGHLQSPERLLEAHLAGTLESARSKLNAREQTLQSTNAALFSNVQEQYREIEELTRGLEGLVEDLEGVDEMVQDI